MEYVSFVWMTASETLLGRLAAIQTRAVKIIALTGTSMNRNTIQPLTQRRQVCALTLFHRIYHENAPILLNSMHPPPVALSARGNQHLTAQLL